MKSVISPKQGTVLSEPKAYVEILPKKGRLHKINLHTHSTVSDGSFTPEKLKEMYMAEGYIAVAFTDHRKCVPHSELTDENFVALTGTELDFNRFDESGNVRKVVHINAIARDPQTERTYDAMEMTTENVNRTISELKNDGFIVTMNHPVWSDMSTEDVISMKGFDCMEVFNSIGVMYNNYSDDSAYYEHFLRAGERAVPIAADDCHCSFADGTPFVEYFRGFNVVKTEELTYDSVINAIESGATYASTGPMFENIWLEGDILHVESSPVSGVFVHCKYLLYKASNIERTDCITHTELNISGLRAISPYIWVQLRDTKGNKAWAMPYWFD